MTRASRLAMRPHPTQGARDEGRGDGVDAIPTIDTLGDRLRAWRNGLVGSPAFRRFAARFAPTRPIARRHAARLFDLAAGFVYSQVLAAFVRLGLVERLFAQPMDVEEVARATGLTPSSAETLLRAAASLDLAEPRSGGRYGLGMRGAALVGNDGVRAMVEHHALLYGDLADPVALLRGETRPRMRAFWNYGTQAGAEAEAYSRLMAASQAFVAEEVIDALPLAGVRRLVDVGGGSGAFLAALARRRPDLELTLFDLPAVAEIARVELARSGARVSVVGGSFHAGPLPAGADMMTLVRVLHDHDDAEALALLLRARQALGRHGRLVVAEPMAGTGGAEASGDAYFGFYLHAMGQGRPRRFDEIAAMAHTAGFATMRERATATPLLVRVAVCGP